MKNFTIIFGLILISAMTGFAQFTKGTFLAGGGINGYSYTDKAKIGSTTSTTSKESDFDFTPRAGYFIMDNFALGAGISFDKQTSKPTNGDKITGTSTSFNPFARYYFKNFYGILGGKLGSGDTKLVTGNEKYKITGAFLGVGYAWFLNDYVAIEPQVGYNSYADKFKATGDKLITSGLYLSIGIQVYLRK